MRLRNSIELIAHSLQRIANWNAQAQKAEQEERQFNRALAQRQTEMLEGVQLAQARAADAQEKQALSSAEYYRELAEDLKLRRERAAEPQPFYLNPEQMAELVAAAKMEPLP